MTIQIDNHPPRIFKYADKTFPDPGAEYSVEQVLAHLRTFFPELGHAKTEEKTLDNGTQEITFSKQVTRKGALPAPLADPAAIDTLVPAHPDGRLAHRLCAGGANCPLRRAEQRAGGDGAAYQL